MQEAKKEEVLEEVLEDLKKESQADQTEDSVKEAETTEDTASETEEKDTEETAEETEGSRQERDLSVILLSVRQLLMLIRQFLQSRDIWVQITRYRLMTRATAHSRFQL